MGLVELLAEKREALIDMMMSVSNAQVGTPREDTLQFIRGFVDLVERAAGGDPEPMHIYLDSVVPGIKAAGMPLPMIMDGMVRVAMCYTSTLPAQHHPWAIGFNAEYTRKLIEAWEAA